MDENIPTRTVEELRALGHDVLDIRGTPDQGTDDEVLWSRMLQERRILVTSDKRASANIETKRITVF